MTKKYMSVIAMLVLLSPGCSKRPKEILSEEKMVAVMTDLEIAEAYERSGGAYEYLHGRNREMLGRGVLMHHGVTPEQMDCTLAWYGRNMDEYPKLYKKIDDEINRRQLKYARAAGESENVGSSADLWPYSRHFVLDDKSLTNGITVTIPANEIEPGVKLTWKMTVDGADARILTLGVDYSDGTSEIYRQNNRGYEKNVEVSLQTDSILEATRIFAIADFEHSRPRVFIDSVQLTYLPFNREEYIKKNYQRSISPAGRKIILPPDTSTNSSLVPEAITSNPSESTENSRGVSTRR
ncbi:MAG: DUF4296 domain-containing protein [Muribaculaceae bacterium]|nr:DUF4296 domain-containing protein [Muribaculaceae bacterium]